MFYKYTVDYRNGTKLNGYAMSDKSMNAVRKGIEKQFFGDFRLEVEKYGTKFPKVNSDYILNI